MGAFDNLTFAREKTIFGSESEPRFVIKSNRTAFTLSKAPITERIVVRGKTLAGTVRMTSLVAGAFLRSRTAFREEKPPDFAGHMERLQSPYENTYIGDNWVSVHINGKLYFTTMPVEADRDVTSANATSHDIMDLIEQAAKGREELPGPLVRDAIKGLVGEIEVKHESQTAVVVSESSTAIRVAVLERDSGSRRSVSMTVLTDKTPVRFPALLVTTADIIESMNLADVIQRAAKAPESVPGDRLIAAMSRRRQMLDGIRGFERAYQVRYRPDRPTFFEMVVPPQVLKRAT